MPGGEGGGRGGGGGAFAPPAQMHSRLFLCGTTSEGIHRALLLQGMQAQASKDDSFLGRELRKKSLDPLIHALGLPRADEAKPRDPQGYFTGLLDASEDPNYWPAADYDPAELDPLQCPWRDPRDYPSLHDSTYMFPNELTWQLNQESPQLCSGAGHPWANEVSPERCSAQPGVAGAESAWHAPFESSARFRSPPQGVSERDTGGNDPTAAGPDSLRPAANADWSPEPWREFTVPSLGQPTSVWHAAPNAVNLSQHNGLSFRDDGRHMGANTMGLSQNGGAPFGNGGSSSESSHAGLFLAAGDLHEALSPFSRSGSQTTSTLGSTPRKLGPDRNPFSPVETSAPLPLASAFPKASKPLEFPVQLSVCSPLEQGTEPHLMSHQLPRQLPQQASSSQDVPPHMQSPSGSHVGRGHGASVSNWDWARGIYGSSMYPAQDHANGSVLPKPECPVQQQQQQPSGRTRDSVAHSRAFLQAMRAAEGHAPVHNVLHPPIPAINGHATSAHTPMRAGTNKPDLRPAAHADTCRAEDGQPAADRLPLNHADHASDLYPHHSSRQQQQHQQSATHPGIQGTPGAGQWPVSDSASQQGFDLSSLQKLWECNAVSGRQSQPSLAYRHADGIDAQGSQGGAQPASFHASFQTPSVVDRASSSSTAEGVSDNRVLQASAADLTSSGNQQQHSPHADASVEVAARQNAAESPSCRHSSKPDQPLTHQPKSLKDKYAKVMQHMQHVAGSYKPASTLQSAQTDHVSGASPQSAKPVNDRASGRRSKQQKSATAQEQGLQDSQQPATMSDGEGLHAEMSKRRQMREGQKRRGQKGIRALDQVAQAGSQKSSVEASAAAAVDATADHQPSATQRSAASAASGAAPSGSRAASQPSAIQLTADADVASSGRVGPMRQPVPDDPVVSKADSWATRPQQGLQAANVQVHTVQPSEVEAADLQDSRTDHEHAVSLGGARCEDGAPEHIIAGAGMSQKGQCDGGLATSPLRTDTQQLPHVTMADIDADPNEARPDGPAEDSSRAKSTAGESTRGDRGAVASASSEGLQINRFEGLVDDSAQPDGWRPYGWREEADAPEQEADKEAAADEDTAHSISVEPGQPASKNSKKQRQKAKVNF